MHILFIHAYVYYRCDCDRLKKDGTAKLVPPIGRGFLHVVDSLFWHLHVVDSLWAQRRG